jgi:hypothetical protein
MPLLQTFANASRRGFFPGSTKGFYGKNWISRTMPMTGNSSSNATYHNSVGFMIGNSGVSNTNVYTSLDGITWTTRAAGSGTKYGVVGMASDGSKVLRANNGNSQFSTDGITWTYCSVPTASYADTAFVENGYYIFWDDGSGRVTWGTTGTSWTTTLPSISNFSGISDMVYGNGSYVFFVHSSGSTTCSIWSTTDLSTTATSSTPNGGYGIAFGSGLFITGATAYNRNYSTSTNGISWTSRTLPFGSNDNSKPMFFENTFYIQASSTSGGLQAGISEDGITWTAVSEIPVAVENYAWAGGNKTLLVIPNSGTPTQHYTSTQS